MYLHVIKKIFITIIRLYQLFISPFFPQSCRFYPTCSEYALTAIKRYGPFKGVLIGFKRILRCHPFSPGGYDPLK